MIAAPDPPFCPSSEVMAAGDGESASAAAAVDGGLAVGDLLPAGTGDHDCGEVAVDGLAEDELDFGGDLRDGRTVGRTTRLQMRVRRCSAGHGGKQTDSDRHRHQGAPDALAI
nr:hypothetical protein [Planomonospora sp. ID67723]